MTRRLGELAWPEVPGALAGAARGPADATGALAGAGAARGPADATAPATAAPPTLAVPLGACEQHGPHLPLDTDTRVAVALAEALAAARPEVVTAPSIAYGSSGEHEGFAGTVSLGGEALHHLLVELIRSATRTFPRVLLVNGHGGNVETIARAVAHQRGEGRAVRAWHARAEGDAHAGRTETSLMLALAPQLVRVERAEAGATEPLAALMPALRADGVRAVAPNGVLGDPAGASADEGRALLARMGADLIEAVAAW